MTRRGALLFLALLALAGCDRAARLATTGPAGGDTFTLTLDGTPPPTLRAVVESRGASATLRQVSRRGEHTVWRGPAGQTVTLRQGIVVATTAFTPDLFSVEASLPSDWRASVRPATASRVHRYVGGDEREFIRGYQCVISADQPETLTLGSRSVAAARIDEACGNATQSFTNSYWLDDTGQLVQSRQWLGPEVGYVRLTHPSP